MRRLAPLQVRIAPQRAQAAARRIHQHAVDLAGQALDLGVVLGVDQHGVHVGQPAARQARLEVGQALLGHVERIEAAGGAHQRAQGERLATRARAKIDHHLAALGRDQVAQQLAAFILHFDQPVDEHRQLVERRLAGQADAGRRHRRHLGLQPRGGQLGQRGLLRGLD